jgi:lysophospholipase L1-like esterase
MISEVNMESKIELRPNDTIVFIGDSITDADRRRPAYRPFGYGYVHFVANTLLARYAELNLNIVNTGISGDTVVELERRWQRDCLDHRPDVLSVLIGVNDVWRLYTGTASPACVGADEYEVTYSRLLLRARQECECRIVLMEPFMFCDDTENVVFKVLAGYIEAVRRLAQRFGAVLVPLQSRIDEVIGRVPPDRWSVDMVHPHVWAHAWIAQQWLVSTGS